MSRDPHHVRTISIAGFLIILLINSLSCERSRPQPTSLPAQTENRPAEISPVVDEPIPVAQAAPVAPEKPAIEPVQAVPQPQFRAADQRRRHDDARLKQVGIEVYESKRLKLYTDVSADQAGSLPGLIDQAYIAWENYFGPLLPDAAGTDFQITGYLIRNWDLFRELELIPSELQIEHGLQHRNEFWMRDQQTDYFRQHLLIHEATHCYMAYVPAYEAPQWYVEGMAEYFAAHRIDDQNRVQFCVMPSSQFEFAGWGRILKIREDVAANRAQPIKAIFDIQASRFRTISHYAWSWALCEFLDQTPRYRPRFRQLASMAQGNRFVAGFDELFQADRRELDTEWALFSRNIQYGYDMERAAINFSPGTLLIDDRELQVQSDHGWQSSQIRLESGRTYKITATGQFTLADQPKPWLSEPQGISIRYHGDHPIGMLVGCIRTEDGPAGTSSDPMLKVIAIGRSHEFQASHTGTLYLRVNDDWNSLADNRGHIEVRVQRVQ